MPQPDELRVFISSTFRDLQEEREHLVKKVFPEIRALCRRRGVTFTDVDLRWGLTEEEADLGRVIRTCLEEVDKCRPWFIGILGNRYGWVPELHDVLIDPDLLTRYPWVEEVAIEGKSVTEMEFIHGVFEAPEVEDGSTFFYHRAGNIAESDNPENLQVLIDRARSTRHPFREFESVERLGEMVREDLQALIDHVWPEDDLPSEVETERRAHAAFAASRIRAYIPNPLHLAEFTDWLSSEESLPLVVHGPSGLGKSSLIAYLAALYRRKDPTALVIEHYIGASDGGGSAVSVMRHVIAEICDRFGLQESIPTTAEELRQSFPQWLLRGSRLAEESEKSILVVIDAVNQTGESDRQMTWLPATIPSGVRLIISTTPGESCGHLLERGWHHLEVAPLADERVRQSIVVRYLGEFRKGISSDQIRRVVADPKADSPLYLRVVAEELRLHGTHETLDEVIDRFADAETLLEVFDRILERMEVDYGRSIVEGMMRFIEASHDGLTELELGDLVGAGRLELSRLLFALDYHLLHREGLLDFFHDYLRRAVRHRYLTDEESRRTTGLRIAEYFEARRNEPRGALELFRQRRAIGDREELTQLLGTLETLDLVHTEATEHEVFAAWSDLMKRGVDPERVYLEGDRKRMSDDPTLEIRRLEKGADVLKRLGRWNGALTLYREVHDLAVEHDLPAEQGRTGATVGQLLRLKGNLDESLAYHESAIEVLRNLPDRRSYARAVGLIGILHRARGEQDEALARFTEWEEISRTCGDMQGAALAIANRGVLYLSRGDDDRAMSSFRQWLLIAEENGDQRGIAGARGEIARVHQSRREYTEALGYYRENLSLYEALGDHIGISQVVDHIGLIDMEQGRYADALENFERERTICREAGDRRGEAFADGHSGEVYRHIGDHEEALRSLYRAAEEHRALGFKQGLATWLVSAARTLLEIVGEEEMMPTYLPDLIKDVNPENWKESVVERARIDAEEGHTISEEIARPDTLNGSAIALALVRSATGQIEEAWNELDRLLAFDLTDDQRAEVHYLLWYSPATIGASERDAHRNKALDLYQHLLTSSPNRVYHKRIDRLQKETE